MYFPAITLISQGLPPLRGVKQRWSGENKLFSSNMRQYLGNGKRYTSKVTIKDQQEVAYAL